MLRSILKFSDEDVDEIKHNISNNTQEEIAILINITIWQIQYSNN